MKKSILTIAFVFLCATLFSQENNVRVPSGYQGFLEMGNLHHFTDSTSSCIDLSTTHGFYFGGKVFAGIGIGVVFNNEVSVVPIYTSVNYVFNNSKTLSPVAKLRIGSYISNSNYGTYADLGVGVRFASAKDFAVSLMLAGTYYDPFTKKVYSDYYDGYGYSVNIVEKKYNLSGVSLRFGIEW